MVRKWFLLANYSLLINLVVFSLVSYSTIPEKAADYYNTSQQLITLLAQMFFIMFLVTAPINSWLLANNYYLSMIIAWILFMIGSWVKFIAGHNYWVAFLGTTIISCMNSLILVAISTLA